MKLYLNSKKSFWKYHPRLLFILGFFSYCIGIWFENTNDILTGFLLWSLFLWLLLFILNSFHWKIIISLFLIYIFWFGMSHFHNQKRREIYTSNQEKIFLSRQKISGTVDRKMYTTEKSSIYRLIIDCFWENKDKFDTKVDNFDTTSTLSIAVEVPKNLDIYVGEKISFTSKIFPSFKNIYDLKWFDKYSWYHRLFWKTFASSFEVVGDKKIPLREKIQDSIKTTLFKGFPKDITAILLGITVGNTDFMSQETKDNFQASGLTHILVVSGSNITFLILFLWFFIKYIPLNIWIKRTVIIWFLLFYGYIVGWDVPVIRATVMGIIGYLATQSGQKRSVISTLFAVAWGILIFSPLALVYDAGFGLSFWATLGIITLYTPIQNFFEEKLSLFPKWFFPVISITLAASIWSFPVLIYHFGSYPLVSIVANILIWPFLWGLLTLTILYLIFGLFWSGWLLFYGGYIIYYMTTWMLFIGKFFSKYPTIKIPEPFIIPVAFFLMTLFMLFIFSLEKKKLLCTE